MKESNDRSDRAVARGGAPPWRWLSGFAQFLLLWPLLGLIALGQVYDRGLDLLLGVFLVPPGVGLVLLVLDAALTRVFGATVATRAAPSVVRDASNTALCLAALLGVDLAIVGLFEDEGLLADPSSAARAVEIGAALLGVAVALRVVHRVIMGPARRAHPPDDESVPAWLRFVGYFALVTLLIPTIVMIDDALRDGAQFGRAGWTLLPAGLFIALRSAMARSPSEWGATPDEARLRELSLALPWWILAWAAAMAVSGLLIAFPIAADLGVPGRILAGVMFVPIALVVVVRGALLAWSAPALARELAELWLGGQRERWRRRAR